MYLIREFEHAGNIYLFEPPIKVGLPRSEQVRTMGEVAAWGSLSSDATTVRLDNLPRELLSTTVRVNRKIEEQPGNVLSILSAELDGKHSVSLVV